jgi:hypothetical protein
VCGELLLAVAEAPPELAHASARCLVAIHFLGRFRQLVKCARISLAVSRLPQPQPQGIVKGGFGEVYCARLAAGARCCDQGLWRAVQ